MPPSTPSILLVDDDPDICLALGDFLVHQGYLVETAPRGQDAIAKAQTCRFDAALLDLGLPDMDGLEVTMALHRESPIVRIIVLTGGSGESDFLDVAKLLGAHRTMKKPVTMAELVQAMQQEL